MAPSRYGRDVLTAFTRAAVSELNRDSYAESTQRIRTALDDPDLLLSSGFAMLSIVYPLWKLSLWYRLPAVAAMSAHDTKRASAALHSLCQCDLLYWHFTMKGRELLIAESVKVNTGGFNTSKPALSLCIALGIGLIQESEALYRILKRIVSADDDFIRAQFSPDDSHKTPPTALRFYERSVLGAEPVGCGECGVYSGLIESHDRAPAGFSEQVVACCDYHVANSRSMTKNKSWEFGDSFPKVYPAEILMFLHRRRCLGLEIDIPAHKLTALPTFHVFGPEDVSPEQDPLLGRLMELAGFS